MTMHGWLQKKKELEQVPEDMKYFPPKLVTKVETYQSKSNHRAVEQNRIQKCFSLLWVIKKAFQWAKSYSMRELATHLEKNNYNLTSHATSKDFQMVQTFKM